MFLGARVYEYPTPGERRATRRRSRCTRPKDGLGVLRDPERTVLRRANEPAVLMAAR